MLTLSHQVFDLFDCPLQFFGKFHRGWVAVVVAYQFAFGGVELLKPLDHVYRKPDCAALIGEGACYSLPNPPRGIGTELETPVGIIFFDCTH